MSPQRFNRKNASVWISTLLTLLKNGDSEVAEIGIKKLKDAIPLGVNTIHVGERAYNVHSREESVAKWDMTDLEAYLNRLNE